MTPRKIGGAVEKLENKEPNYLCNPLFEGVGGTGGVQSPVSQSRGRGAFPSLLSPSRWGPRLALNVPCGGARGLLHKSDRRRKETARRTSAKNKFGSKKNYHLGESLCHPKADKVL